KIIDAKTKLPIFGAIVLNVSNQKNACYSNEEGVFSLHAAKGDSLKISCIGYEDTMLFNLANSVLSQIELKPKFIVLNEVVVSSTLNTKTISLGNIEKYKGRYNQGGTKGSILLVYVPNHDSDTNKIVTKLKYLLDYVRFDSQKSNKGTVRVRLYSSKDDLIFPKDNLLQENIIKTIPLKSDQLLVIDISKYQIKFPINGVFVGLEWLGEKNNTNEINLNPGFRISQLDTDSFTFISFYGKPFIHTGKTRSYYDTPVFGIDIEDISVK
ncbi:MAG: carboxypeptidase-like regulatory domain-containing protein, partial [Alphaproteobacteria bacterium]|nr:carboxypeptidase-like regulatory domain-containing protein [Alphaproteobacteria bacterium]